VVGVARIIQLSVSSTQKQAGLQYVLGGKAWDRDVFQSRPNQHSDLRLILKRVAIFTREAAASVPCVIATLRRLSITKRFL
jgi:hypothetical protein